MNREILFRGKRVDNNKWVEGDLMQNPGIKSGCGIGLYVNCSGDGIMEPPYSCYDYYEVDPKTVSQFTGVADKNEKKMFEGDEFLCKSGTCKLSNKDDYDFIGADKKYYKMNPPKKGIVVFDKCSFRGCFDGLMGNPLNCYDELEIIGNKYE